MQLDLSQVAMSGEWSLQRMGSAIGVVTKV
jgi:hypothetical protein